MILKVCAFNATSYFSLLPHIAEAVIFLVVICCFFRRLCLVQKFTLEKVDLTLLINVIISQ